MDGYRPGSIKTHPDYPENPTVAIRTSFEDNDDTGCTSWLTVTGGGVSQYRTEAYVAAWPDAVGLTLVVEPTPSP